MGKSWQCSDNVQKKFRERAEIQRFLSEELDNNTALSKLNIKRCFFFLTFQFRRKIYFCDQGGLVGASRSKKITEKTGFFLCKKEKDSLSTIWLQIILIKCWPQWKLYFHVQIKKLYNILKQLTVLFMSDDFYQHGSQTSVK